MTSKGSARPIRRNPMAENRRKAELPMRSKVLIVVFAFAAAFVLFRLGHWPNVDSDAPAPGPKDCVTTRSC